MALTPTGDLVAAAAAEGRGVASCNVVHLEHIEALIAGAEAARAPIILQISENAARYHGALKPLAVATLAAARASATQVAVHLDHATGEPLVQEAIGLGFGSVMFDASRHDHEANVAATRQVARGCHERGVFVEAELGEVGGKDGVHAPGVRTDPEEARSYVEATGVDALAVAVGTSHAMLTKDAALDAPLIARLRHTVPVPLVLHGSSGVPDDDLARAIDAGITKINIATHFNKVFTQAVRSYLVSHQAVADTRTYLAAGRAAMEAEVPRMLDLLRSATSRR